MNEIAMPPKSLRQNAALKDRLSAMPKWFPNDDKFEVKDFDIGTPPGGKFVVHLDNLDVVVEENKNFDKLKSFQQRYEDMRLNIMVEPKQQQLVPMVGSRQQTKRTLKSPVRGALRLCRIAGERIQDTATLSETLNATK
jgi:hypothetical protein